MASRNVGNPKGNPPPQPKEFSEDDINAMVQLAGGEEQLGKGKFGTVIKGAIHQDGQYQEVAIKTYEVQHRQYFEVKMVTITR
ncbi:hypothetical protein Tsubulata_027851 [Turnera subulata]|uniref:Protein kinase domain-containing protein n=1 Tax=Turnera subulata TaxID=218843 RepID=A0A9Q0IZQ3_9ROSI|nr:hypothetical protein Tsubulata_027851 [Turnera subulata]